jgi:hypothetical protein
MARLRIVISNIHSLWESPWLYRGEEKHADTQLNVVRHLFPGDGNQSQTASSNVG